MDSGQQLSRFIDAQDFGGRGWSATYEVALSELRRGRKVTHWIWYVFPQLEGLGRSEMCDIYGIRGIEEATAYLANPTLRERLVTVSEALLELPTRDAQAVLGRIDARKVRSCMTLFSLVEGTDPVFGRVIDEYYGGQPDPRTLELLGLARNEG